MNYVNDVADLHEFNELVLKGKNEGMSTDRAFDYAWDNVEYLTLTDEEVEVLDSDLCVEVEELLNEWKKLKEIKLKKTTTEEPTMDNINMEEAEVQAPKMIRARTGWIIGLAATVTGITGGFFLGKRTSKKASTASHLREVRFASGE